ncbi:hypothetical protein H6F90_15205 [Trichocoleus sp. FACHB-591]|uniref:HEPN domain-containing protein n=1 Tax=Trichocoleus sp. FACHB-591 TaxID=2692872 RepID=UPI0016861A58|nr:HEPN domain-containing protein [Trichocoleus sp. FACHB-591]MBD2096485.1 hypothetical protein [Trichocoleus sp. FACHB-591]
MSKKDRRTIVQAIKEVMTKHAHPMFPEEIYEAILRDKLYTFGAVDPLHIVKGQIRKHCKGLEQKNSYSKTKYFFINDEGKYFYLSEPEFIGEELDSNAEKNQNENVQTTGTTFYPTVKSIKEWFLSEYEPLYDRSFSSFEDNEYIADFDGPFLALDVIKNKFWGFVSPNVISKAVELLEDEFECFEWSKIPKDRDINSYYLENLSTDFYKEFTTSISHIIKLSRSTDGPYTLKSELEEPLNRMLYANIITAMESYLSDAFIKIVLSKEERLRRFVETTKEFQNQKISLSDIFIKMDGLKGEVTDYLTALSFHNLPKVEALYKASLGVEFPKDSTKRINKAIAIRHDIVHRNGKNNNDGNHRKIGHDDIKSLAAEVKRFLREVDKQLRTYYSKDDSQPGT